MNDGNSRSRRLIQAFDKVVSWWGSLLVIALLSGLFFVVSSWDLSPEADWKFLATRNLLLAVSANLLPIFLVFAGSYLVFRKIQELKVEQQSYDLANCVRNAVREAWDASNECAVHQRFNQVGWDELIKSASRIDIMVHYLDSWMKDHSESLISFLQKRDAKLRIVQPDYDQAELFKAIKTRFSDMDDGVLRHKFTNTGDRLRKLREQANATKATVKIYRSPTLDWYCLVRFNDTVAVISPYEGERGTGTEAPAFLVDLKRYPKIAAWIEKEVEAAVRRSSEDKTDG